jgi:hypothetical protein
MYDFRALENFICGMVGDYEPFTGDKCYHLQCDKICAMLDKLKDKQ